jgi:hypothetical protein
VARGALVTLSGVTRAISKSCAIYLCAVDVTQFHVHTAPRCDWDDLPPPPPPVGATLPVHDLYAAPPAVIDRRQLRLRVRCGTCCVTPGCR